MEETQTQLDYYVNHGRNTPKMGITQPVEKRKTYGLTVNLCVMTKKKEDLVV